MDRAVLEMIKSEDLALQGPLFEVLVEKVKRHRQENNGFVPLQIFAATLGIGGTYQYYETCLRVVDEEGQFKGFALKRRGNDEQGWENEFHIPGTAHRLSDDRPRGTSFPVAAMNRLAKEIYGTDERAEELMHCAQLVGQEIHPEPERYDVLCFTLVATLDVTAEEIRSFTGQWKIYGLKEINSPEIVDHHGDTLRWLSVKNPPFFAGW